MVQSQVEEVLESIEESSNNRGQLVDKDQLFESIKLQDIKISILHINIRSANHNFDNLLLMLEAYNLNFLDFIVLTETFQNVALEQCNINGYTTFHNNGDYNRNDGTIILVRSDLNVSFCSHKLPNSKATISRLTCKKHGLNVGITAVYKPPPIPKKYFIYDIEHYLDTLNESNDIEVYIGDANINILDASDDDSFEYLAAMTQLGFQSYINSVTRFDTGTCLDHLFIRNKKTTKNIDFRSFVIDSHITDHTPILLNITQNTLEKNNNARITTIDKTRTDLNKINNLLQIQDWTAVTNDQNPESSTELFLSLYNNIISQGTERYSIQVKHHKKIKNWITNGLIISIKHRDKLKRKLLTNYSVALENKYKKYRNTLKKLISKQKNDFYRAQIIENKNNIKKMYEIIKDATCENITKKTNKVEILNDNGQHFVSDGEMSNYINNYFINIGIKMEKKIPTPSKPCHLKGSLSQSMYLQPVSHNEIIKHISSLKNNSSPGFDHITANIIKKTHQNILIPLEHIINTIFKTGIVPKSFKTSIVCPIYKSGEHSKIKNYRPISLITNFTKIFEKCMKHRLVTFLTKNKILSENQFGFLEGSSTGDALYAFTSEVTKNLNLGTKCLGIFIDLAKAFDTVPHNQLLTVMSHYGVRGTVLNLINNYLRERLQMVKINNTLSDGQVIRIGVPQGTVLGPILFITYLNALLTENIGGTIISYADDTAIIFTGKDWEEAKNNAIKGFKLVKNWLETYKLSLNLNKTNYIAFSLTRAGQPNFTDITIGIDKIAGVTHTKYLGVLVDQFLKWGQHIDYVSNKIRRLIHKFYILREFLNEKTLVMVYKAFAESLIRYGIIVWGGTYNTVLNKLNVAQKYILKIIFKKNKRFPTNLLFSEDTVNIRTLYINCICNFVYRCKSKLNYVDHTIETRTKSDKKLKLPKNLTTANKKFIDYLAPKSFNLLPKDIKSINNKKTFSKKCNQYVYRNTEKFSVLFQ